LAAVGIALLASAAWGQGAKKAEPGHKLRFVLERQDKGVWKTIDPATVLEQGDRVRFRATATFAGYLYVMSHNTSGSYELLFPRNDTGTGNEVKAGVEYTVPATAGYFRIAGPAGHDVLYWVISPTDLGKEPGYRPLPPPPAQPVPPSSLRPRCDDTVFKARGDCVDPEAGPRPAQKLPENLAGMAQKNREMLFIKGQQGGVTVTSPEPLRGPAIYEVRLSHR
jgi:hypothetical protein